jgi:hypothetical protein
MKHHAKHGLLILIMLVGCSVATSSCSERTTIIQPHHRHHGDITVDTVPDWPPTPIYADTTSDTCRSGGWGHRHHEHHGGRSGK